MREGEGEEKGMSLSIAHSHLKRPKENTSNPGGKNTPEEKGRKGEGKEKETAGQ